MAKTYKIKDGQEAKPDEEKIIEVVEDITTELTLKNLTQELAILNNQLGILGQKRDDLEYFIAEIRKSVGI